MIVYFTASIVGKKYYIKNYQKIISLLKTKNYDVISDHIINMTELQIRLKNREERFAYRYASLSAP